MARAQRLQAAPRAAPRGRRESPHAPPPGRHPAGRGFRLPSSRLVRRRVAARPAADPARQDRPPAIPPAAAPAAWWHAAPAPGGSPPPNPRRGRCVVRQGPHARAPLSPQKSALEWNQYPPSRRYRKATPAWRHPFRRWVEAGARPLSARHHRARRKRRSARRALCALQDGRAARAAGAHHRRSPRRGL